MSDLQLERLPLLLESDTQAVPTGTPLVRAAARRGVQNLDAAQRSAVPGEAVPIVFCRRVGDYGGVLISPPATEARFTNNSNNDVTASYLLVLTEGRMDGIQTRDWFQQSCRVGTLTVAYDRRAGAWAPGNFITPQVGFEDQVPQCPIFCGSGTGSYAGMTTASFTVTIPAGFTQWDRQVHVFARGGMHVPRILESETEGPSNNFVDLYRWGMLRTRRVAPAALDQTELLAAATFLDANGLRFDGVVEDSQNIDSWLDDTLRFFLLRQTRSNGKRTLRPLLPTNADGTISLNAKPPALVIDESNWLPGSFEMEHVARADRMPFVQQVLWRQQPDDAAALVRTVMVRYENSAPDGPYEQIDLTAFCATEDHAFKVGAYLLARRRYVDHRLKISIKPGILLPTLVNGDVVKVRLGRQSSLGGPPFGHNFLYQCDRVVRNADGGIALELTHYPVTADGVDMVARDVLEAVGNGILLPTGRAPVGCDLNSDTDTTVPVDDGPWEDWDVTIDDPPLPDFEGVDFGNTDYDDPADDPLTPPDEEDEGYQGVLSFTTPLVTYPAVFYGALFYGYVTVEFAVEVDNPPVDGPLIVTVTDGRAQSAAIIPEGETRSAPVRLSSNSESIQVPTIWTLSITGASGGGYRDRWEVVNMFMQRTAVAIDTSSTETFKVSPYFSSVTIEQSGLWQWDYDESKWWLAVDSNWEYDSVEQKWQYLGSPVPDWEWVPLTQEWQYTGSEDPAPEPPAGPPEDEWTWDKSLQQWVYIGDAGPGWTWDQVGQKWEYSDDTDWIWNPQNAYWEWFGGNQGPNWIWIIGSQSWRYIGGDDVAPAAPEPPPEIPAGPPSPPPDSPPPLAGRGLAAVLKGTLKDMPVPDEPNNFLVEVVESQGAGSAILTIPATSTRVVDWRWNPAAGQWEHLLTAGTPWRWHPELAEWQYVRPADLQGWRWDSPGDGWTYDGSEPTTGWVWNVENQQWEPDPDWVPPDPPAPQDRPDIPSLTPPLISPPLVGPAQGGVAGRASTAWPPDGERLIWEAETRDWSGNFFVAGGTPLVAPEPALYSYVTVHLE